jgi:mitogen-activated protein kinase kinase
VRQYPASSSCPKVLQGLAFLTSKEVAHTGIQPSNLLLSREGIIKLSEFGVSHELLGAWVSVGVYIAVSRLHICLLSRISLVPSQPEHCIGKEYTILSDIWSTGITLLEFVQGRYPLPPNLSVLEIIIHIVQKEGRLSHLKTPPYLK